MFFGFWRVALSQEIVQFGPFVDRARCMPVITGHIEGPVCN